MKKKIVAMVTSLVLVAALAVGGTLAWLTDTTETVTNTFTVGNVDITLVETWNTDTDNDGKNDAWSAKLIPGEDYLKDPKVTVVANSEPCYLFVQYTETNSPEIYLDYSYRWATDGWTALPDVNNVYYRQVPTSTDNQDWYLLNGGTDVNANGQVTVKDTVGGSVAMPAVNETPQITFQAFAIQSQGFTSANDAWNNLQAQIAPTP